jgi:hypothetical protein
VVFGRRENGINKSASTGRNPRKNFQLLTTGQTVDWMWIVHGMVHFTPDFLHQSAHLDFSGNSSPGCRSDHVVNARVHRRTFLGCYATLLEKFSGFIIPSSRKRPLDQGVFVLLQNIAKRRINRSNLSRVQSFGIPFEDPFTSRE